MNASSSCEKPPSKLCPTTDAGGSVGTATMPPGTSLRTKSAGHVTPMTREAQPIVRTNGTLDVVGSCRRKGSSASSSLRCRSASTFAFIAARAIISKTLPTSRL